MKLLIQTQQTPTPRVEKFHCTVCPFGVDGVHNYICDAVDVPRVVPDPQRPPKWCVLRKGAITIALVK